MLRGVFVTGTDTSVGKTVVSAAILSLYRTSAPVRYWKPIQTGIEQDDDTAEVRRLAGARPSEVLDQGLRYSPPVSPHLAATWAGEPIDIGEVIAIGETQSPADRWIVEGAGGALVPLNESSLMVDLILRLALPVVVVARSGLGTINHTLLTIEALRARSIRTIGVVMVGALDMENRLAIEYYGGVRVMGELPVLDPLDADSLSDWAKTSFDRAGALLEVFR